MSHRLSTHSATESLPDKLDLQMLHGAQEHLRCLRGHQPSSTRESEAWQRFYETYDPLVRRYVLVYGLRESDAEDCLQEVWNEVVRTLAAFESDGTRGRLCSWLYTIVHSKVTNFLRYRATHPCKHLGPQAEAGLQSRETDSVDDYERHCLEKAVQRVLALLRGEVTHRIFYMRCIEDRKVGQIASELNLSTRQVTCRLYHA